MALTPVATETKLKKPTDEPKYGKVVDNNDPEQLGKIKVTIPGIYDSRDISTLPWIRRKGDTTFCGIDCELFDVPEIGSIVQVDWEMGENTPQYTGAINNKKQCSNEFKENYPYQGGIKFGPNVIKFDKKAELIIIKNSKCKIVLDGLGGCTANFTDLDIVCTRDANIKVPNLTVDGNLLVTGTLGSEKGASGTMSMMTFATVQNGIVAQMG